MKKKILKKTILASLGILFVVTCGIMSVDAKGTSVPTNNAQQPKQNISAKSKDKGIGSFDGSTVQVSDWKSFQKAMQNSNVTDIQITGNFALNTTDTNPDNTINVPYRSNLKIEGISGNYSNPSTYDADKMIPNAPNIDCGRTTFLLQNGNNTLPNVEVDNLNVYSGNYYGLIYCQGGYGNVQTYKDYGFVGTQPFVNYNGINVLKGMVRINQVQGLSLTQPGYRFFGIRRRTDGDAQQLAEVAGLLVDNGARLNTWFVQAQAGKDGTRYINTDTPSFQVGQTNLDNRVNNVPTNPNTGSPMSTAQLAIADNTATNIDAPGKQDTTGQFSGLVSGFDVRNPQGGNSFTIGNNSTLSGYVAPGHCVLSNGFTQPGSSSSQMVIGNSKINITVNNNHQAPVQQTDQPTIWSQGSINMANTSNSNQNGSSSTIINKDIGTTNPANTGTIISQNGSVDLSNVGYIDLALQNYSGKNPGPIVAGNNNNNNANYVYFNTAQPLNAWSLTNSSITGKPDWGWPPQNNVQTIPASELPYPKFNASNYSRLKAGTSVTKGKVSINSNLNNARDSTNSNTITGTATTPSRFDGDGNPINYEPYPNAYIVLSEDPNDPNIQPDPALSDPFNVPWNEPDVVKKADGKYYAKTDSNGNFKYQLPKGKYLTAGEKITATAAGYDSDQNAWYYTDPVTSAPVRDVPKHDAYNPYNPTKDAGPEVSGSNDPANNNNPAYDNDPALLRLDAVPKKLQFNGDKSDFINNSLVFPLSQANSSLANNPTGSNNGIFTQFTYSPDDPDTISNWQLSCSASPNDSDSDFLSNASLNLKSGILNGLNTTGNAWVNYTGLNDVSVPFTGSSVPIFSNSDYRLLDKTYQTFWDANNVNLNLDTDVARKLGVGTSTNPATSSGTLTWTLSHGPTDSGS